MSNPIQKNFIPSPLQSLSLREVFIFTGISFSILENISKGKYRPNDHDRRRLTIASMPFYNFNRTQAHAFVMRKKFRLVRNFISPYEKNKLLSDSEKYEKRLNEMFSEHWDKIVVAVTERFK